MVPSPPNFPQDKVPYRVIDVDATLLSKGGFRFCQADSISDFCVVSHKWNPYVIALMNEIKNASTEQGSWDDAATKKNWADVPATKKAYQSIKKFLKVLQAEGVKKVWMDTLCIDQRQGSKEMPREIELMGAYYRHSSACYVHINGFGYNYQLKMGRQMTKGLEWLNRVWTLQEFLLPDTVHFLVELEPWMEKWLALRVATAGEDLQHFCSCCMQGFHFMMESLQKMSMGMKDVTSFQMEKITEPHISHTCQHCGSPPLLRKAFRNKTHHKHKTQARGTSTSSTRHKHKHKHDAHQLYLVHREVIFLVASLAQFHTKVQNDMWEETPEEAAKRFDKVAPLINRNEWLLRIVGLRKQGSWFGSFEIFNEICSRQCTEERDRILGVLGILGVNASTNIKHEGQEEENNVPQLTAATPEKQLVELASSGAFSEQLLVEFCWMDEYSGRSMPQMSWIPDVTSIESGNIRPLWSQVGTKEYHSMATNVYVDPHGPITLTVKVLKGYITCEDPKNLSWQATHHVTMPDHHLHFRHHSLVYRDYKDNGSFAYSKQFGRKEVQLFNKEHVDIVDQGDRYFGGVDGKHELTFNEDGCLRLPFKDLIYFKGFEMWLLYLGHYRGKGTVLLCLHKRGGIQNEVHKIGTLNASYMGMLRLLDKIKDPPQVVTISGYGKYLDDHVDL